MKSLYLRIDVHLWFIDYSTFGHYWRYHEP